MSMAGPVSGKTCFVGFYGLDRSLRWTAPSIRKNILEPLNRDGFSCFLGGHFNRPAMIHHPTNGEHRVKIRHRPGKYLDLDLTWLEPQSDAQLSDLMEVVLSVPFRDDLPDPTGAIRKNIAYQLHSLRRLAQMVELAGPDNFCAFLLLRPDIEYIDPLETSGVMAVAAGEVDLISPSWHLWGGMNDRFCIANYDAAKVFMNRAMHLQQFCSRHGYVHPEALLRTAVDHAKLRVRTTEQRALRVRATGETRAEGFRLPKLMRLAHRARPLLNGLP